MVKKGKAALPIHMSRPINFIIHMFEKYDGKFLEFPVRPLYKAMPAPRGCVLLNRDGKDLLIVQSPSFQKTTPFEDVGPLDILTFLRDAGLELILDRNEDGQV